MITEDVFGSAAPTSQAVNDVTVPGGTITNLLSNTFAPGRYLCHWEITFTANADASQFRLYVGNESGGTGINRYYYAHAVPVPGTTTPVHLITIENVTGASGTTLYLNAYHNATTNITCTGGVMVLNLD